MNVTSRKRTKAPLLGVLACLTLAAGGFVPNASAAGLDASKDLNVPAWTKLSNKTTYPTSGTYDVSQYRYLGGFVGLEPGETSAGVVTFDWYKDRAGTELVGVQGLPVSSLIVSTAQLRVPNLGPYVKVTFTPFTQPYPEKCAAGGCPFAMRLFGTNRPSLLPLIPGDSILIDTVPTPEPGVVPKVVPEVVPPETSTAIYPDDYFTGPVRLFLESSPGVTATLYGTDLTGENWPLDKLSASGSTTTFAPFGTWFVVVSNPTTSPAGVTLAATPLETQPVVAKSPSAKPSRRPRLSVRPCPRKPRQCRGHRRHEP